jgi:hypothetical protein
MPLILARIYDWHRTHACGCADKLDEGSGASSQVQRRDAKSPLSRADQCGVAPALSGYFDVSRPGDVWCGADAELRVRVALAFTTSDKGKRGLPLP